MTIPCVIETPLRLEPVTIDAFAEVTRRAAETRPAGDAATPQTRQS